ncbi:hypothetical protein ACJU26_03200 [Acidithiobacillus sp. M4-SHS-6]|uniref:hypothetical protein n=1 Tax=Acidithiobacillus sp. M4-SHS-6 TaxID=3383024 RepID=UPI0039BEAB6C
MHLEMLRRFPKQVETVSPAQSLMSGVEGHLWEQFALPSMTRDKVLFSPSNTRPLHVQRQVVTIHDVVPIDHPEGTSKNCHEQSIWENNGVRTCRRLGK